MAGSRIKSQVLECIYVVRVRVRAAGDEVLMTQQIRMEL